MIKKCRVFYSRHTTGCLIFKINLFRIKIEHTLQSKTSLPIFLKATISGCGLIIIIVMPKLIITTDQRSVQWPQYVAGLSAAGGALATGTALGWSAPATPRLVDEGQYFPITASEMDWASSIVTIGCAASCLPIGFLMNKFGRKWTMISLIAPFMLGWTLVTFAQNFIMLLLGRFFIGLAGGAFCVSAPQYSSEIAEKEIRGIVGTFFQLLVIAGILFVYTVGAFVTVFWLNVICAVIPLVFGLTFCLMPESPVYLIINNREAEAKKSLTWLRGSSYDPQDEVNILKQELLDSQRSQESLKIIFSKPANVRSLIIGIGLMFFQQVSGINVVIFYATLIFKAADTGIDSDLSTIIVGAVHLVATFASSMLVDRLGRKVLLLISIVVMSLSLTALGVFFFIQERDSKAASDLGWLPLSSLSLYIIAFALGFGPIPWLMLSEVYSKEVNAVASPVSGALNWSLAFIITATFGTISSGIGIGSTFWVFSGLSVIGTIFVFLVVPETKGKSMLEIQRALAGEKNVNL